MTLLQKSKIWKIAIRTLYTLTKFGEILSLFPQDIERKQNYVGQVLSICSKDIERKRNFDMNEGP